ERVPPKEAGAAVAVGLMVSNVMLYLVVQILPPSRYNEKEFTMVSAVRFVELIVPLRLSFSLLSVHVFRIGKHWRYLWNC
uniref:Uncharacterized protein n=1 Tax=Aegilops tauschii subsp. strangulata TaxID=200361 RepID=A0A453LN53_AEGTS